MFFVGNCIKKSRKAGQGETRRAEESNKYGFSLDFECQMAAPGLNDQFQAANTQPSQGHGEG